MVKFPSTAVRLSTLSLIVCVFAADAANSDGNSHRNTIPKAVKSAKQLDRNVEKVALSKDRVAVALDGVIKGYQTVDYLVEAHAGQILTISFQSNNLATYFNVIEPNADFPSFNGAMLGNSYTNKLSVNGSYTIRVYMMRNAAARKESAVYTLNISLIES